MKKKNYEDLDMTDDFMFGKVMGNKELCREVLETLLEIPIDSIEYPEKQRTINITYSGKSVRLDVYVQDNKGTVYDAEMQRNGEVRHEIGELPKRCRYYQGMIDLNSIEKGQTYKELKECYIIFICTFDPFGKGRSKYTFRTTCDEEKDIGFADGSIKVFYNTKGTKCNVSDDTKQLLNYLENRECTNELTQKLDAEIIKARANEGWRREYMKTLLHDMEEREAGREEGRERVNHLNSRLAELGRTEDILKAANDKEYQELLFDEFSL
ncbi:MAG: Rpn family recombination-promoting nuclease/putative transposase [Lachnospiraceae bacterium]|nr:Rpn family recombination-promoting nuclease/putative transposase [Lachnospiraceae bacterium]